MRKNSSPKNAAMVRGRSRLDRENGSFISSSLLPSWSNDAASWFFHTKILLYCKGDVVVVIGQVLADEQLKACA